MAVGFVNARGASIHLATNLLEAIQVKRSMAHSIDKIRADSTANSACATGKSMDLQRRTASATGDGERWDERPLRPTYRRRSPCFVARITKRCVGSR
jgi:hypothetical protein